MAASAPAESRLRVVLVDDHPLLRAGVRALLTGEPDIDVVGEADSARTGVELAAQTAPDLIVMDVSLPDANGAEATKEIKAFAPDLPIIALSVHEDVPMVRLLLDAGAAGYLLKRSASEELIRAVRVVANGGTYVDPSIAGQLLRASRRSVPPALGAPAASPLSERESEVVRLLAQGLTIREIAAQLVLSPRTLETYRARALEKLQLKTRADLFRYAVHRGWLNARS